TFLNLNMNLGTSYRISDRQTGSLFLQRQQTIVNGVNTALILQTRQLPNEADVSSLNLGLSYNFNSTDYRFNPKKGNELTITSAAGTKSIKRNTQVLELKDPSDPSFDFAKLYDTIKPKVYQFRVTAAAAHYVPVGKQSTIKLGINAGIYQSASYFRNELFRIGGYRLLRGFDEESQFVSQYAIGTLEYRYLIGLNSAFFAFADGGYGRHLQEVSPFHTYLGTGLGLSFETKAGIINLAWAVGRRDDVPFNLRQSKVHLGFASFF
ncbi:MAG: BamA/TamA family outer membrane protein, partial [Flavisolibacter sp.]